MRKVKRRYIRYAEQRALFDAWGWRCAYCGKETRFLEPDHVEPLSRGGDDTIENLIPACGRCNGQKSNLFLLEWALVRAGFWKRTKPNRASCRVA